MSQPARIIDIFKTTEIWKHFTGVATPEKLTLVENLSNDALGILDRIIETFPTYTFHNGQHQLNILNNYAKILGHDLEKLTDLETALLILSAFYHDIGMVFKKNEKENLREEEYFNDFLVENERAQLDIAEDKGISDATAEWYCRWSHAKRVWKYLNPINDKLIWEGTNFRKQLAQICLSHNEETKWIKIDNNLSSSFWNGADLRFCAILLRLADVLDFDDTRTSKSVFKFLELDSPKSQSEEISRLEWEKHFASRGFTFNDWNQNHEYSIDFQAAPNCPSIEHNINVFLNYIEKELNECISILNFCSDKWNNFKLPNKIDRHNIISQGYTFGDFKFSLDQEQVLSLLMGEELYGKKFVFIRELAQNAIDTSRHREFHEKNKGNQNFVSKSINIATWYDEDGYRWIRYDDFGMGMTYSQILKYFLKVGNSYYNSNEFKVEKLNYKAIDYDFIPISRFGIGILSCFIVADVVEVNTRSVFSDDNEIFPIRLSLKGLHNYYVLQTNKDIPSPMPGHNGFHNDYRKSPGTSIAIRINPNNDLPKFNLSKILDKILFNPKISVNLINKGKKGIHLKGLDIDSSDVLKRKLSINEKRTIENFVRGTNLKSFDPEIQVVPINLNQKYTHPNIKGFLNVIVINTNLEFIKNKGKLYHYFEEQVSFSLSYTAWSRELILNVKNNNRERKDFGHHYDERPEIELSLNDLIEPLEIFTKETRLNKLFDSILLAHNGIIVPNKKGSNIELSLNYNTDVIFIGYIELLDKLRPNLSISRNKIISIPWVLWSSLNFTIRRNFPDEYSNLMKIDFLRNAKVDFSHSDLNEDELLFKREYWPSEKIFGYGEYSLIDILDSDDELNIYLSRNNDIESILKRKLIELYADYKISLFKTADKDNPSLVLKASIEKSEVGKILFQPDYPPLSFCEYKNFDGLMPENLNHQIFNINHPYSIWLIRSYVLLNEQYSNHLFILMNNIDLSVINNTLNKLRYHLPDHYKPPTNLCLTENDFKIDYNILPIDES